MAKYHATSRKVAVAKGKQRPSNKTKSQRSPAQKPDQRVSNGSRKSKSSAQQKPRALQRSPQSKLEKVKSAAHLFAIGTGWEDIARWIDVPSAECRKWPAVHESEWHEFFLEGINNPARGESLKHQFERQSTGRELMDFFENTYLPIRLIGRSIHSSKSHGRAIRSIKKYLGREATLADLSTATLAGLAGWCYRTQGNSPASANNICCHLRALWNLAFELQLVKSPPKFTKLPTLRKIKPSWGLDDIAKLLEAAASEPGYVGCVYAPLFWQATILTFFDTGARRNALLNVRVADYDPNNRTILIRAENQKHKSDQLCRVSEQTAGLLAQMLEPTREFLFPWPNDRYPGANGRWKSFSKVFRKIVVRAGLDPTQGLAHRLRRTRATFGESVLPGSATADLQHSSREVTVKHYIDTSKLAPSPVVDMLPRPKLTQSQFPRTRPLAIPSKSETAIQDSAESNAEIHGNEFGGGVIDVGAYANR